MATRNRNGEMCECGHREIHHTPLLLRVRGGCNALRCQCKKFVVRETIEVAP